MTEELIVRAPAKINLGLRIIGRRNDGFHELESVMQQISLHDVLRISASNKRGISFLCSDKSLYGPDNLVVKAAELLLDRAEFDLKGVRLELYKNIPVEAGLAGGSSDAAAALIGLNRFWQLQLGMQELMALGSMLGSDIPYCLQGGTALVKGRGEILESLPGLPFFWVVLALPADVRISTADAYRAFNHSKIGLPSLSGLVEAVKDGKRKVILEWLSSDFTNTLETADLPGTRKAYALKKKLREMGLPAVYSGSGPTLFIVTSQYGVARNALKAIEQLNAKAILCWTIN